MGENCAFQNLSSFTLSPDSLDSPQQSGAYTHWHFNWQYAVPDAINMFANLQDRNSQLVQYPRFRINKENYQSPASFHTSVQLRYLTPNQAIYQCALTPALACRCEIVVPSSNQCVQKFSLTNTGEETQNIALEWFIFLKGKTHQSFSSWNKSRNTGLYLDLNELHILSSIAGPTKIGQHSIASLQQHALLAPGETGAFFIISNIASTKEECEKQLFAVNTHNWDASFACTELKYKASQIKITCENQDWNTVLAYSQIQAVRQFGSLTKPYVPAEHMPSTPSPEQQSPSHENQSGFFRENAGISVFTLYYFWQIFGAAYAIHFRELLEQVFDHQRIDGQIYWTIPEPAASLKGNMLPILANWGWQIHEHINDIEWLRHIYPKLKKYLLSWFSEFNDKDQDGCPEWRNPHQAGFSEAMLFQQNPVTLHPYYFRQFEHPGLLSLLIGDFRSLATIARELDLLDEQALWQQRATILSQHLQKFQDKEASTFQVLDYFTHQNPESIHLLAGKGEINSQEHLPLKDNCRIQMDFELEGTFTRPIQVQLQGKSGSITIKETITFAEMIWVENQVTAISQYTYTALEKVNIKGLKEEESWLIKGLHFDFHDISMLLPHIKDASSLSSQPVYKLHLSTFGLSLLSNHKNPSSIASMPWNALILEKLIQENDIVAARDLMAMMLQCASKQFSQKSALFEYYDNHSASGYGERDHIHGLIPQALFLQLLGIKKISQEEICITHFNPFSTPFTVQYKGMKLNLFSNSVEIHFRGFVTRITQTGYHRIRFMTNVAKQI